MDLHEATVVTLYLLSSINSQLGPKLLQELRPGTRIISRHFQLPPGWVPEKLEHETLDSANLFLYRVPEPTPPLPPLNSVTQHEGHEDIPNPPPHASTSVDEETDKLLLHA